MRGKRPRLVTIGDLTVDIVVRPAGEFDSGTDVPAQIAFRAGGSAANTARAFSRLGGAASFVGAVGADRVGRAALAALRADGVTAHLVEARGHTARLIVSLAPSGERSFLTDRGAADALRPRALRPEWLARADVLHLPAYSLLNPPLSLAALDAARLAHTSGALVSIDLASKRPLAEAGPEEARKVVLAHRPDILFANHEEATVLIGEHSARRLLELAPVVVIKAGAAGCTVIWNAGQIVAQARPIKPTDTTGAGDAFDAGFLFSLIATGRELGAVRSLDFRHAAYAGRNAAAAFIRGPRPELAL